MTGHGRRAIIPLTNHIVGIDVTFSKNSKQLNRQAHSSEIWCLCKTQKTFANGKIWANVSKAHCQLFLSRNIGSFVGQQRETSCFIHFSDNRALHDTVAGRDDVVLHLWRFIGRVPSCCLDMLSEDSIVTCSHQMQSSPKITLIIVDVMRPKAPNCRQLQVARVAMSSKGKAETTKVLHTKNNAL